MRKIKIALSVIFTLPVFIPTVILAILSCIFSLIGMKKAAEKWLHFWLYITIWWIWICFGASFRVEGKENIPSKGCRVCYIANHLSMMDIPAIFYAGLWSGVIGKVELKKIAGLNIVMKELNCVYIDRKSIKESLKAILEGAENIKKGIAMTIFPEGTRSKDMEMGSFKAGSFKMATKAKAEIVPVVIFNTRYLFENKKYFIKRVPVLVKILAPVKTENMSEEELRNVPDLVETMIRSEYEKIKSGFDV